MFCKPISEDACRELQTESVQILKELDLSGSIQMEKLVQAIQHPSWKVRVSGLKILKNQIGSILQNPSVLDLLVCLLFDDEWFVRKEAFQILSAIPFKILFPLFQSGLLQSKNFCFVIYKFTIDFREK